jgi:hypothetical protein
MGLAEDTPGAAETAMTGTFFALAFLSALDPKLFAVDLVLIESARPRQRPGQCALRGARLVQTR